MILKQNGKLHYHRFEILSLVKCLRDKYRISPPLRQYADCRSNQHPSSIQGYSLKYYLLQSTGKDFKKFSKKLTFALDLFGLKPMFTVEPSNFTKNKDEVLFSLQIYRKEN